MKPIKTPVGFFASLKASVDDLKHGCQNVEDMIEHINQAWEDYDSETIDRIWGHQLACYREIMKCRGDNVYKAPHSGVRKRQNEGADACAYDVDWQLFNECRHWLNQQ